MTPFSQRAALRSPHTYWMLPTRRCKFVVSKGGTTEEARCNRIGIWYVLSPFDQSTEYIPLDHVDTVESNCWVDPASSNEKRQEKSRLQNLYAAHGRE